MPRGHVSDGCIRQGDGADHNLGGGAKGSTAGGSIDAERYGAKS